MIPLNAPKDDILLKTSGHWWRRKKKKMDILTIFLQHCKISTSAAPFENQNQNQLSVTVRVLFYSIGFIEI